MNIIQIEKTLTSYMKRLETAEKRIKRIEYAIGPEIEETANDGNQEPPEIKLGNQPFGSIEHMKDLREKGWSYASIARKFDVSTKKTRDALREVGL